MKMQSLLLAFLSMFLVACGGSGGSGGNSPTPTPPNNTDKDGPNSTKSEYKIEQFSITPTEISPYIDSGNITLSYQVKNHETLFMAKAYVSINETLSDSDIEFYSDVCVNTLDCGKKSPYSTDCFFTNNNELYCGDDIAHAADLTPIIDALPKNAYIILETCDSSTLNCDTASVAVTFE